MTSRRFDHCRSTEGFTLLEALVATAMMGLILTALAIVTAQWMPNWNRGIARVQRGDDVALGISRLVADVTAAEFVPVSRDSRRPLFDGADRSVVFVRTVLNPNSGPGLEIVRIAEISSDNGKLLVRTHAPFRPGADPQSTIFRDPVVLLRTPYRVSFSYAGPDRNWHEEWRNQIQLPKAVKLTVQDAATQRALSVSTAALMHVDVPMQCSTAKSIADCLTSQKPPSQSQPENRSRS